MHFLKLVTWFTRGCFGNGGLVVLKSVVNLFLVITVKHFITASEKVEWWKKVVFLAGNLLQKMPTLLLAFDFDHTIIDDNSDTVVRDLLKEKPTTSYSSCGWTSYMQEIFTKLAAQGTTESQIRKAVEDLQEVEGFLDVMESLHDLDAEVIIISDSNEYFIHHWLVGKGIAEKVKKVFTNPAKFVGGELKIEKYHVQDWCQNSTENLCKGYILENYINERKCEGVVFDQVFYVGDGQNDYCPSTKLREIDVTFPRVGYALQKKLDQLLAVGGKTGVQATIQPWTTHNDILNFIRARKPE